jgi:hypothetical protein
MAELGTIFLSALTTLRHALPSTDYSLESLIHPALLLLCTLGVLSASVRNAFFRAHGPIARHQRINIAAASCVTSLILCILLSLRRHPLAYVGLAAPLPPSLEERVLVGAFLTPFVRLEAALRPLASALDAALPRPPHAPRSGATYAGSLWAWWRPARVAARHLAICAAALAHDFAFGTALLVLPRIR